MEVDTRIDHFAIDIAKLADKYWIRCTLYFNEKEKTITIKIRGENVPND